MSLEVTGRPSIQITIQPCGEAAEVWSKHSSFYTWLLRMSGRLQRFPPVLAFKNAQLCKAEGKSSRGEDPQQSLSWCKCLISRLFFHTKEVTTVRKRGAQNPAQQRLKGSVKQKSWPVHLILSGLSYFESKTSQPYLKAKTFLMSPFKQNLAW